MELELFIHVHQDSRNQNQMNVFVTGEYLEFPKVRKIVYSTYIRVFCNVDCIYVYILWYMQVRTDTITYIILSISTTCQMSIYVYTNVV